MDTESYLNWQDEHFVVLSKIGTTKANIDYTEADYPFTPSLYVVWLFTDLKE